MTTFLFRHTYWVLVECEKAIFSPRLNPDLTCTVILSNKNHIHQHLHMKQNRFFAKAPRA